MKNNECIAIKRVSINKGYNSQNKEIYDSINTEIVFNDKTFFEISIDNIYQIKHITKIVVLLYDFVDNPFESENSKKQFEIIKFICEQKNIDLYKFGYKKIVDKGEKGEEELVSILNNYIDKNLIFFFDRHIFLDKLLYEDILDKIHLKNNNELTIIRDLSACNSSMRFWKGKIRVTEFEDINSNVIDKYEFLKKEWNQKENYLFRLLYKKKDVGLLKSVFSYYNKSNVSFGEFYKYYLNNKSDFYSFPEHLIIEVTNDCQHSCNFCPKTISHRNILELPLDIFKKIINEKKNDFKNGKSTIEFSGYGEPLLNKNIYDMIEYAKINLTNIEIDLYTNGELLTLEVFEQLNKSGCTNIFISLDAVKKETYNRIHGRDVFNKVKSNLNQIIEYKKNNNIRTPKIIPNFVLCDENKDETFEFIKKYGVRNQLIKNNNTNNIEDILYSGKYDCYDYAVIRGLNNFSDQMTQNKKVADYTPTKREYCKQFKKGIFILSNGNVTICRQDFKELNLIGNVKKQSIKEMMFGSKYPCFIKNQEELNFNEMELCKNCREWFYSYD